jgi:hypothetical protein
VTAYEHALAWVTDRFEGVDPAYRRDVELTTRELTSGSGLRTRSLELLGLVALALRLRSRARTGSRPEEIWHQGVYAGSVVLLVAMGAAAWASTDGALTVAGAAALSAAVVAGLRGRRFAAIALAVAGAAAHVGADPSELGAGAFATSCIVAVGGLAAGTPSAPAAYATALAIGAASAIGLPLTLATGADASAVAATFTAAGAVVLLALGWFDPRLAAAATTLIFARLLATGFDELAQALAVLSRDGGGLLVRWIVMSAGVVVAWLATRRSIRRLTNL